MLQEKSYGRGHSNIFVALSTLSQISTFLEVFSSPRSKTKPSPNTVKHINPSRLMACKDKGELLSGKLYWVDLVPSCPKSCPLVVPYCWSLAPPCGRNLQWAVPPPSHCVLLSGSSDIPRGVLQKDLGESSFQGSHHPPRLVSAEKFASEISSPLLLEWRKRAQNLG